MSNVVTFPSRALPEPEPKLAHPADVLSFMKRRKPRGGGINYWLVDQTGNYPEKCNRGKQLATEYLTFVGQYPAYGEYLLSDIVHSMIERAEQGDGWTGVHLGFLCEVNRYAIAMAKGMHEEADE